MEVYIVLNNNHEDFHHTREEWVDGIYATKELAIERVKKLKTQFINYFIEEYLDEFEDINECQAEAIAEYQEKPARYKKYNIQTEIS